MDAFTYRDGILCAEDVPLPTLAEQFGTPLFVYSRSALRDAYRELAGAMRALKPLICYSVKANSNMAVLKTLLGEGAGLDIVSGGELFRALRAGADPQKIVFAGVGKTREEIDYALDQNIRFFTVESEPEVRRISQQATARGRIGRIAFRINPNVDPKTHTYISTGKKENKFGLDIQRTIKAYALAAALPGIEIAGLHMHIGSQILTAGPFGEAITKIRDLCRDLKAKYPTFTHLDIGGGIGIRYRPEDTPLNRDLYASVVTEALQSLDLQLVIEPGRSLVGNAGILLSRVQYVKDNAFKKFVVADAGMNDLIRPSLYQAFHEVLPVHATEGTHRGDLVGPICESGDFIAQDRDLPAVGEDALLAIKSAGAYGFSMASTYNSRPLAAEVMVDGAAFKLVRKRGTLEQIVEGEAAFD